MQFSKNALYKNREVLRVFIIFSLFPFESGCLHQLIIFSFVFSREEEMEVFLKLKKALQDLNGELPDQSPPPLDQPSKVPNGYHNDMNHNRNENPWQDNPHHGNFPPGFMFGRDRRGGLFSEIDKEFEELDRFMQNSRQIFDEIDQTRMGFGQMFKDLSEIEQNSKLIK